MPLPTWLTRTRVALLLVCVVAIALRFTLLGWLPPGLYPDEAAYGNDALAAASGAWDWFYPGNGGREGLFVNLQAVALWLIGLREPWVLRLVAAIAGILTVPGVYLLGKELWSRRAGLLASAILAGSFWHVALSRIGFRAILAPLVLAWALWLFLYGVRRIREGRPYAWLVTASGGALAGLGFHTYLAFRASALVFAVTGIALAWLATAQERERVAQGVALAGVCALLVAAPLLGYFATHPGSFTGRANEVSVFAAERPLQALAKNVAQTAGMLVWEGDRNWRHNDSGAPQLPLPLFAFFAAGVAYAGHRLAKARGRDLPGIVLAALLVAGAAPAVFSNEGVPHALRAINLLVPVCLLAGYGLERTWAFLEGRGHAFAGAFLATAVAVFGIWHTASAYPLYARRPEVRDEFTKGYLEAGRALLRRDPLRDAYVIVPDGDVLMGGAPVAAQTTMFMTGTATRAAQERERIFYVTSTDAIPMGADVYDLRRR